MIEILISFLIFSAILATAVVVYTCIIVRPGEILSEVWTRAVKYLPDWLHKPLISCEKCVGGQAALFLFPVLFDTGSLFSMVMHVLFILITIFFTQLIKKLLSVDTPEIHRKTTYKPPELNDQPTKEN